MTYVTWQRQDDVTYAKMCLPSRVSDTMRRFSPLESSKKLQGKNARGGGVVPPLGVRGLNQSSIYARKRNTNCIILNVRVWKTYKPLQTPCSVGWKYRNTWAPPVMNNIIRLYSWYFQLILQVVTSLSICRYQFYGKHSNGKFIIQSESLVKAFTLEISTLCMPCSENIEQRCLFKFAKYLTNNYFPRNMRYLPVSSSSSQPLEKTSPNKPSPNFIRFLDLEIHSNYHRSHDLYVWPWNWRSRHGLRDFCYFCLFRPTAMILLFCQVFRSRNSF